MAEIITLHPRADAPVQSFHSPRPFGTRGVDALKHIGAAFDCAREDDRAQQERVKRLAREARNALDGRHVCPSLRVDLAARIRGVAQQLETLASEAKSYGLLSTTIALRDHAGLLEREAAIVEPAPEPA